MKRSLPRRLLLLAVIVVFALRPGLALASSVTLTDQDPSDDSGMIIWDGDFTVLTMGFGCSTTVPCDVTRLGSAAPSTLAVSLLVAGPSALSFSQLSMLITVPASSCTDSTVCESVAEFAESFKPDSDVCWDPPQPPGVPDGVTRICNTSTSLPDVAVLPLTLPSGAVNPGSPIALTLTPDAQEFLQGAELLDSATWEAGMVGFSACFSETSPAAAVVGDSCPQGTGVTALDGSLEEVTLTLEPTATSAPEPGTIVLVGSAAVVFAASRRPRRRR